MFDQKYHIDKLLPTPLYFQLKTILDDYIEQRGNDYETPIPTEIQISEYFNISRPTVRQAINELVVEGKLYRIKSKGTFISKPKIRQDFLIELESFNNEMRKKGLTPTTKVLGVRKIPSDKKIAEALNLTLGTKVIELSRLRYTDQIPLVYVVTYLPYDRLYTILDYNFEQESLYRAIEAVSGLHVVRAKRTIESTLANEAEARLLEVKKGAPIQYFESITYLSDDSPIEFSLARYRADRSRFTYEFKRD